MNASRTSNRRCDPAIREIRIVSGFVTADLLCTASFIVVDVQIKNSRGKARRRSFLFRPQELPEVLANFARLIRERTECRPKRTRTTVG